MIYPEKQLTNEEFVIKQQELIEKLPEEFRQFAISVAWCKAGHNANEHYSDIIRALNFIVNGLQKPIEEYMKRIKHENIEELYQGWYG